MANIKRADLDALAQYLTDMVNNKIEGDELDEKWVYVIHGYNGGVALERANGSITISGVMTKRELYNWIHAYKQGIWDIDVVTGN